MLRVRCYASLHAVRFHNAQAEARCSRTNSVPRRAVDASVRICVVRFACEAEARKVA